MPQNNGYREIRRFYDKQWTQKIAPEFEKGKENKHRKHRPLGITNGPTTPSTQVRWKSANTDSKIVHATCKGESSSQEHGGRGYPLSSMDGRLVSHNRPLETLPRERYLLPTSSFTAFRSPSPPIPSLQTRRRWSVSFNSLSSASATLFHVCALQHYLFIYLVKYIEGPEGVAGKHLGKRHSVCK